MSKTKFRYVLNTCALSIAGFDPTGGAGILADIKTFEAHKVYGLGVCSALTFQNDWWFDGVKWVNVKDIIRQISILFNGGFTKNMTTMNEIHKQQEGRDHLGKNIIPVGNIEWVKIGLIENLDVLDKITDCLMSLNPGLKIVWDPIIKASSGFVFHEKFNESKLIAIMKKLFLITPNLEEFFFLSPPWMSEEEAGKYLSQYCSVLLKGGHRKNGLATDKLFDNDQIETFYGDRINNDKHGTGCVLSSSILAWLARGYSLKEACAKAKKYISGYLKSNSTLLGNHVYE